MLRLPLRLSPARVNVCEADGVPCGVEKPESEVGEATIIGASLSVIVVEWVVCVPKAALLPPEGDVSVNVIVSLLSVDVSSFIYTVAHWLAVELLGNVRVCVAGNATVSPALLKKSELLVAVPPVMFKLTVVAVALGLVMDAHTCTDVPFSATVVVAEANSTVVVDGGGVDNLYR